MSEPSETYFTFADRSLSYDCLSCRQRCCRGKGIALGADELIPLLQRERRLAPALRLRPGGTVAALNFSDRCWFLGDGGLCGLEVEHGRAIKPVTCRLFPFNRVYRVGQIRVVDMNSMLCPLGAAEGDGVRHADLLNELAELKDSPLLSVQAALPAGLPDDWLARERAACAQAGGEFADAGSDAAVAQWGRLYALEGREAHQWEAAMAPLVTLLVPSLRWNRIFRRTGGTYGEIAPRLQRRLRGLLFLGGLGARAMGGPLSLRALTELWEGQAGTLDVFERWDEPVRLTAPRFDADVPALLHGALGALLGAAFRGGRTLGELVQVAAATLPAEVRPLSVALTATQLGTLCPPAA